MIKDAWIDLHVHTTASDGIMSPTLVVRHARKAGLKAVGIVDHDTVAGLEEAHKAAREYGIEVVPGVELSSQMEGRDLHILGYFIDSEHPRVQDYLKRFQDERYRRAEKMVRNLNGMGVTVTMEEVEEKAEGKSIGRPHIADVLMERGYVETFQEAFYRYIGYGSKAYEEKYRIRPDEAIALVSEAGGLSFLAHPGHQVSDNLILRLVKAGVDGLEIVHPKLSEERTMHLQQLARRNGLLVCGGSDCHGGRDGRINIGVYRVPYAILDDMRGTIRARKAGGEALQ